MSCDKLLKNAEQPIVVDVRLLRPRGAARLVAEREITVDHVTVYRWVWRFTPLVIDAARPCRHECGDRWFVDETYVKVAGRWVYLYRTITQDGQVIDVLAAQKRDLVPTGQAPVYPRVIEESILVACHVTELYANNRAEAGHGLPKARLLPANATDPDRQLVKLRRVSASAQPETRFRNPTRLDGPVLRWSLTSPAQD